MDSISIHIWRPRLIRQSERPAPTPGFSHLRTGDGVGAPMGSSRREGVRGKPRGVSGLSIGVSDPARRAVALQRFFAVTVRGRCPTGHCTCCSRWRDGARRCGVARAGRVSMVGPPPARCRPRIGGRSRRPTRSASSPWCATARLLDELIQPGGTGTSKRSVSALKLERGGLEPGSSSRRWSAPIARSWPATSKPPTATTSRSTNVSASRSSTTTCR